MDNLRKLRNPRNARSIQSEHDWGYAFGLAFDTDDGTFKITTDKPFRAIDVGAIPIRQGDGWEWTFDKQVVALAANLIARIEAGDYPTNDETFEMPTEEQAAETFARLGIPRDENAAEDLMWRCEMEGR